MASQETYKNALTPSNMREMFSNHDQKSAQEEVLILQETAKMNQQPNEMPIS